MEVENVNLKAIFETIRKLKRGGRKNKKIIFIMLFVKISLFFFYFFVIF